MNMRNDIVKAPNPDELPAEYGDLLAEIKTEVRRGYGRAMQAVNTEMIAMYWRIGKMIVERQARERWGTKVVERLSVDLRTTFPNQRGFSKRSLDYMLKMARIWPEPFLQQPAAKLPWTHIQILIDKLDTRAEQDFYAAKAVQHGWSRNVLSFQIKTELHRREGAAPSTFASVTPEEDRDMLRETVKDPYNLDFLTLGNGVHERDLEDALVGNMTRFLQELGHGFSYMGRQYPLRVGSEEFRIDLLFYHVGLRRFVVFELKTGKFQPAFVGQLNFYVNVVDGTLRKPDVDGPTLGILLVVGKENAVVEYTLHGMTNPLAVADMTYQKLPSEVQAALPDAEQLTHALAEAVKDNRPEG